MHDCPTQYVQVNLQAGLRAYERFSQKRTKAITFPRQNNAVVPMVFDSITVAGAASEWLNSTDFPFHSLQGAP